MEQNVDAPQSSHDILRFSTEIVSAYVSNNATPPSDLPSLLAQVHPKLTVLVGAVATPEPAVVQEPAVSIKKSITNEFLICLDDGKKYRSLKRHIATLGMTPDQYRAKWGLPDKYPMVAPGYATVRSELAKQSGLGTRAAAKTVKAAVLREPAKRGRPKKAA
jgi:predicted transcriptional regulator